MNGDGRTQAGTAPNSVQQSIGTKLSPASEGGNAADYLNQSEARQNFAFGNDQEALELAPRPLGSGEAEREYRAQYDSIGRGPIRPQSTLPKSVSSDKLPQDPLSGAGGRALLFDLDKKFDEQDRMIKFLMQ